MHNLELGVIMYIFSIDDLPVAFKNYLVNLQIFMTTQQDTAMTYIWQIIKNYFQTILFVHVAPFRGIRYLQWLNFC